MPEAETMQDSRLWLPGKCFHWWSWNLASPHLASVFLLPFPFLYPMLSVLWLFLQSSISSKGVWWEGLVPQQGVTAVAWRLDRSWRVSKSSLWLCCLLCEAQLISLKEFISMICALLQALLVGNCCSNQQAVTEKHFPSSPAALLIKELWLLCFEKLEDNASRLWLYVRAGTANRESGSSVHRVAAGGGEGVCHPDDRWEPWTCGARCEMNVIYHSTSFFKGEWKADRKDLSMK